jgi:hypothetical protein
MFFNQIKALKMAKKIVVIRFKYGKTIDHVGQLLNLLPLIRGTSYRVVLQPSGEPKHTQSHAMACPSSRTLCRVATDEIADVIGMDVSFGSKGLSRPFPGGSPRNDLS